MRFLHFILSHSIFIACCAAALCFQTTILLHAHADVNIYGFVFFATLCSYNFYWLLSKFYFSKRRLSSSFFRQHASFFLLCALAGAGMLFFLLKVIYLLPFAFIGICLTLIYSLPLWPFSFSKKLQRAGFFKTTILAVTWAYITAVLPAVTMLSVHLVLVTVLFIARFFFVLLLCIIFDMRDISVDKLHGLHSLATDTGRNALKLIIGFVFACYIAGGIFVRYYFHDNLQLIAFAVTGLFVWFVYRLSLKKQQYIFYYFLVDGLMLFSPILSFLAAQF